MKQFSSSNSMDPLISSCTPKDEKNLRNDHGYSKKFQTMLDSLEEEDYSEETSCSPTRGKKRRLSLSQVKSLEQHFEVENKLEPERKLRIAEETGLQSRQVAIWFQNRRARWKTKQLEKDYDVLKSKYDALKIEHDSLGRENHALNKQLRELKEKLGVVVNDRENEAVGVLETDANVSEQSKISPGGLSAGESESNNLNQEIWPIGFKGSPKNSHTSDVLIKESQKHHHHHHQLWISPAASSSASSPRFNYSASSLPLNWFQLSDMRARVNDMQQEQQSLYGTEEPCNIFSVDQAPTLHWYNFDQFNY